MRTAIPGIFNVAGDGRLPWSEVAAICGKRRVPMPPFGTELRRRLRSSGCASIDFPPEVLELLRYGRGVDNRRLKHAGFAVPLHLRRRGRVLRAGEPPAQDRRPGERPSYHYERDVENFFRHSPAVVRDSRPTS